MEHLTTVDASFLHLETPETPMHVASLSVFALPDGYQGDYYEDVKALLAQRLHLASIFRRKLATMPFGFADPVWIEDHDVDLDYHVRSVTLRKPGTMAQLEAHVARLHAGLLDRSRPLWEAYVIEGLQGGGVAFYWKAHHSGMDGKAGVELAKVIYDTTPEIRAVPPPRRSRRDADDHLGMVELLGAAMSNAAKAYARLAKALPQGAQAVSTVARLLATRPRPAGRRVDPGRAPRTIFNAPITNQRSYATMSSPLDELKTLARRVGGTVNTVVLAMCASALRQFLADRGQLPEESLVAIVPVSLRAADDKALDNKVSTIRVDLGTDIADPAERLQAIHASSEDAKSIVAALKPVLGIDLPVTGAPWLLSGLALLYGRSGLVEQLPTAGNVLISNVPGSPVPLYLAGARMTHYYPLSIPYHGSALNITVLSYAGKMEWGITACRRALSQGEAAELIQNLQQALKEIEALPPPRKPGDDAVAAPRPRAAAKKRHRPAPATAARPQKPARAVTSRTSKAAAPRKTAPARRGGARRVKQPGS